MSAINNRHQIPCHFTASGLVFHKGHILLVHHKRLGAWVPPGGHIEPMELPVETVVREILEETGIDVEVITEAVPALSDPDAFFLSRPFYFQSVLAVERGERVYHLDLAYLCRLPGASDKLPTPAGNAEVREVAWVEIDALSSFSLAKNVLQAVDLARPLLSQFQL